MAKSEMIWATNNHRNGLQPTGKRSMSCIGVNKEKGQFFTEEFQLPKCRRNERNRKSEVGKQHSNNCPNHGRSSYGSSGGFGSSTQLQLAVANSIISSWLLCSPLPHSCSPECFSINTCTESFVSDLLPGEPGWDKHPNLRIKCIYRDRDCKENHQYDGSGCVRVPGITSDFLFPILNVF